MKNIRVILILILFICSYCSSGTKERTNEGNIEIHELIKKEAAYSSLFQDVKFVKLEMKAECPISGIMKLSVDNDRIFIFDAFLSKVLIFNINGGFVSEIGKKGKGPGEVSKVNDYSINRKEQWIEILDSPQKKILTFDYDGRFLREKRSVFAMGFESFNNESHVFYHYNFIFRDYQGGDIESDVVITDTKGEITNSYRINPINRKLRLTTFTNIYKAEEEEVYILPIFDYSIYQLSRDKTIRRIVNLKFDNPPPEEIFKANDNVMLLLKELDSHGYPNRPQRLIVTDKYYYFCFFEGEKLHQVFIDRSNNNVKLLFDGNTKNDLTFINNKYFVGAYDQGLIQSIDAIDFVRIFKKLGTNYVNYKGANSTANINIAKTLTIDDNPVLLFFNFK